MTSSLTLYERRKAMQIDEKKLKELEAKAAKADRMAEINKRSYERRQARIAIILGKAEKAKHTASEAEVDAYIAAHKK